MTIEILLVALILVFALIFFISGKLRVDVTALIVLCFLAITGLVTPREAVAAFGNPAVVTIWTMYILSAALVKTNIANMIGNNVLKFSGKSETSLIIVIMSFSGLLSAFMNNIGVAALMLPVVMSISRITGHSPSRLLIPMAFGVLLGGFTTILTTINLLVSDALRENNFTPFGLFDFTPVGIVVLISGILFMAFLGKRFLPKRNLVKETLGTEINLKDQYELQERMNALKVPDDSFLIDKSISEINIGTVTGLTVVAILRNHKTMLAPDPSTKLNANDVIIIEGRLDRLKEFRGWQNLQLEDNHSALNILISDEIKFAEVTVAENSSIINKSYYEINFRKNYRINVLAIKQGETLKRSHLASHIIQKGDVLLIRGKEEILEKLTSTSNFVKCRKVSKDDLEKQYSLQERLFIVKIAQDSTLIDKTLSKSRMGAVFGLHVVAIIRGEKIITMPGQDEIIQHNDKLVISCRKDDLDLLRGLQNLQFESESTAKIDNLESDQVGLIEVSLAPRSNVAGKTLRDIHFREKYGLQVIAIWREGKAIRTNLRDIELRFGDALLLMGKREKVKTLKADGDYIILSQEAPQILNKKKAPVSGGILLFFVFAVFLGWLPISTAALSAVVLMIITGCLAIEDVYKSIDWKAIFLIAGMMPLGIAIQKTGTADLVSAHILSLHNFIGDWGILILLYLLITAAGAFIPTSALVVFMAPIFISISQQLGISPYAIMMVLAVSASASFISPVSHPANVLVMGPGGYKFSDYTKVGLPLTIVVMIIGLIMISVFWPL
ncbi:MAG: anion permease [Ignavibacteriaceae bacterium]|nr:anion permease [Ignavibacteriaceae bacterium]